MSGNKGPMRGLEDAAFDKRGEGRLLAWGRGEVAKLKRAFRRRMRRIGKTSAKAETRNQP